MDIDNRIAFAINEVAARMGVHHTTLREAIARGEIETIRVGRRFLIPRRVVTDLAGEVPSKGGGEAKSSTAASGQNPP